MALETQQQEEGKVDWEAAADLFNGKAEGADDESAPETPSEDGMVPVRIRGREVRMPKEAADAYREQMREVRERDGRRGGEIAQLREQTARLEGMVTTVRDAGKSASADDLKPPPAKLAIENFEEWQRQFLAYHGQMMLRQQADLEGKYTTDQLAQRQQAAKDAEQRAWAQKFYAENPHLNKPHLHDIVTSVYRRNAQEIDALTKVSVEDAHERLAELADEAVVAIKSDGKRIEGETRNRPPRLEGAGTPGGKGKGADTFVPATASSWSARKRAQLRGEGAKK
jgi:hypothetical protein